MSNYQNRPAESNLYLTLNGTPATGIPYTGVTVKYRQFGQTALTSLTLSTSNWIEIGSGFYVIVWPASVLSVIGDFFYTVTSSSFDNFLYGTFDVDPVPLVFTIPPDVCVVSGNVTDLGGEPAKGNIITAHLPTYPAAAGGSIISSDFLKTLPDYLGNWQIPLIQGKTVIITLDRTGARYQIVVPAAPSANFLDLIPPIPN